MNRFVQEHRTTIVLGAILFASVALHLYRIDVPSRTVFDEAHFATYASNYVLGQAHFDIHPSLGKMIYAMGIIAAGGTPTEFVRIVPDPVESWKLGILREKMNYGTFPYVPLRVLSAAFGVLLVFAVFLMMHNLGAGDSAALWAAFFTAGEAALLLQTRLILLDGMYLAFGLLALALFFGRERRSSVLGGVLLGCALAVKFIAVVFLAPVLVWTWYVAPNKQDMKRAAVFVGVGLAVLGGWYLIDGTLFVPHEQFTVWQALRPQENDVVEAQGVAGDMQVALIKSIYSMSGYIGDASGGGGGESRAPRHTEESPWHAWPVMREPMVYDRGEDGALTVLTGNPALWLGALFAVLFGAALVLLRKAKFVRQPFAEERVVPLLLAGYLAGLLPFATIIFRSTFLYHYFPSLLFGLCLLGVGTAWGIQEMHTRFGARAAWGTGTCVVLAVAIGFASAARFVYGL